MTILRFEIIDRGLIHFPRSKRFLAKAGRFEAECASRVDAICWLQNAFEQLSANDSLYTSSPLPCFTDSDFLEVQIKNAR